MLRHAFCSAMVCGALLCGSHAALAENRLALVIGESAYRAVTPLPNPANDARAMSKLLNDAGFEVTTAADLSQKQMNTEVGDFAAKIAAKGPDTVALVFYAGHGLQIDGENYLVPVDVDLKREADIPLQAVRLNDVLNTLNSVPSRMRILLLDACRNNPFPAIGGSAGHGLAMVDAKTGAPGTFLSYSTSPGAEAEDGNGADSPYTTALLSAAREPGLPIEEAFKRVRVAVNKETSGRQTPWDSSSLTEDFKFIAASGPAAANAGPMPVATKRNADEWKRELQGKPVDVAHELIVADGTVEAYEAFVALFMQSRFAHEAHEWLILHRRMVAWNDAVLVNTAASYRAFLDLYPDSDLAATARKLIERLRYRPSIMPAVVASAGGSSGSGNTQPASSGPSQPTNASLGPCAQPIVPLKKVDATPPPADPQPPVRVTVLPPREADPVVRTVGLPPHRVIVSDGPVYRRPPVFYRPIGGGFGGGGFRGPIGFGRMRGRF
jgi:Caspase domain